MRTQSPDTPAEIEQRLVEEYRRMRLGQRLMMEMNRAVQQMAKARIRPSPLGATSGALLAMSGGLSPSRSVAPTSNPAPPQNL